MKGDLDIGALIEASKFAIVFDDDKDMKCGFMKCSMPLSVGFIICRSSEADSTN